MENTLPDYWREAVLHILRTGDDRFIQWTKQAFLDWRAATLSQFRYEAYDAMADAISTAQLPAARVELPEAGETFAFFFRYGRRQMYAKVCLRPGNQTIKIISAHTPRKGDVLF
jgi:hypothetical protein